MTCRDRICIVTGAGRGIGRAHATVLADEASGAALTQADYYRDTYSNKPAWQHI